MRKGVAQGKAALALGIIAFLMAGAAFTINRTPVTIHPPVLVQAQRVTGDTSTGANSATTTTLSFSVAASTTYIFIINLYMTQTGAASANFQVDAGLPNGATVVACAGEDAVAVPTGQCVNAKGSNILGTSIVGSSTTNFWVQAFCTITTGATPGTFQFDFLDPLGAGTVTVKAGSNAEELLSSN